MTIRDLYDTTQGRLRAPQPGFYSMGEDLWRRDANRNPALWQATPDHEALAYNEMARELSDKVMMQGKAREAKDRAMFLQSFVNNPNPNVFGKPVDERDVRLQSILQQHANAGNRGLVAGQQAEARNRALERERLTRQLQLRRQALDEVQERNDQNQFRMSSRMAAQRDAATQGRHQDRIRLQEKAQLSGQGNRYEAIRREAVNAVKEGMDPDEAGRLYGVRKEDVSLLEEWASLDDDTDYLNQMAKTFSDIEYQDRKSRMGTATVENPRAVRYFGAEPRYTAGLKPNMEPSRRALPAASDNLTKFMTEAAELGLDYDPDIGFLPPEDDLPVQSTISPSARAPHSVPAQAQRELPPFMNLFGQRPAVPPVNVRTMQDVEALPSGTTYRTPNGKLWTVGAGSATRPAPSQPMTAGLPMIRTEAEARKLPPGTQFQTPDGRVWKQR